MMEFIKTSSGDIMFRFVCMWYASQQNIFLHAFCLFVCVEDLRPSQPNGVMSSAVRLPNNTFTGQA